MMEKSKPAPPFQAGTLGKAGSNNCLHYNHKKTYLQLVESYCVDLVIDLLIINCLSKWSSLMVDRLTKFKDKLEGRE